MRLFPQVSPLALDSGLLLGWASHPHYEALGVELFIDQEKTGVTTTTGIPIPPELYDKVGRPPATNQHGFAFPLPDHLHDGKAHTLQVRLRNPDQRQSEQTTADTGYVAESRLLIRLGNVSGQVFLLKDRIEGHLAFHEAPSTTPEVIVSTSDGQVIERLALTPARCPPGSAAQYRAEFELPLPDDHDAIHLRYQDLELSGSPIQRPQQRIGLLEPVTQQLIHGWAMDILQPRRVLELALVIDGQRVNRFRPNIRRDDIAAYMRRPIEDFGIIGFNFPTPAILLDGRNHTISIEFADDGTLLKGSRQQVCFPISHLTLDEFCARHPRPEVKAAHSIAPLARPAKPALSIIVLNRNGARLLDALFDSFKRINTLTDVEWILIDHASTDDSRTVIAHWQQHLPIHLEALDVNDSFSASCNRGAALARSDTFLFLNNDIVWLQDILPALMETLRCSPDIAALGVKLLKATDDANPLARPDIQHLGIRFMLSGSTYWPYETTPSPDREEAEYGPQDVAGVTGAVLLCRKADFNDAGQFRTEYFYGFEDVEFCLRLARTLGKRIVCRNDLVALHRHGHSRLSGRNHDIFDRLVSNSDILQSQVGLWLKYAYWNSLLSGDALLTNDRLRVAILLADDEEQRNTAFALAKQIQRICPAATPVFMPPHLGWFNLRDVHILFVLDARANLTQLRYQRNDLLVAAWVKGATDTWKTLPWRFRVDCWFASKPEVVAELGQELGLPVASTDDTQLGRLFSTDTQPLRITILTPSSGNERRQTGNARTQLIHTLRQAGAIVWEESEDAPVSTRMAHIRIKTTATSALSRLKAKPHPDCLNILWALAQSPNNNASRGPAGWIVSTTEPTYSQLRHSVENIVARTFHTP